MGREELIQNIMKTEKMDRDSAEKCANVLYGIQKEVDEFVSKHTFSFQSDQDRVNDIVKSTNFPQMERIEVTIDIPENKK